LITSNQNNLEASLVRHTFHVRGVKEVALGRGADDWPTLQFMVEEELDSMLPRGTITYSHNNGSHRTTIDLVLALPGASYKDLPSR
jgi:hypothetical protein